MVFFQAVQALFALDMGFFIGIFMNNLVWAVELWIILDWEHLSGYVFTGSSFLLLYYITKIALLSIAENSPGLKRYMIAISAIQAYVLIIFFTFFMKVG